MNSPARLDPRKSRIALGLLFFAISLAVTQFGGTNALSVWAALRSITDDHTSGIVTIGTDHRLGRSPERPYYSNKAPGQFSRVARLCAHRSRRMPRAANHRDEKGRAPTPGYAQHLILVLARR